MIQSLDFNSSTLHLAHTVFLRKEKANLLNPSTIDDKSELQS